MYIIDSLRTGGKERQLISLVNEICCEHEICILTFDDTIEFELSDSKTIRLHVLKRKKKKSLGTILDIIKYCKTFSPQIVHTWDLVSTLLTVPAGFFLKFRLINGSIRGSAHYAKFSRYRLLSWLSFYFSDLVVSNSKAGLISLNRSETKKFIVVRNGFDLDRINNLTDRVTIRERFNLRTPYVVGMVSIFRDGKDYKTFFEGALHILKKRKDITFISVGDGPTFTDTYNSIAREDFENIRFAGKQTNIESIINVFDIGVMLSITNKSHGEGISNSIMEYMAAGLPVIASDNGGTPEIIKNGEAGFLIPVSDPLILSERINYLIDKQEVRYEMGKRSREIVTEKLSLKVMTDKYLDIYRA